MQNFYAIGFVIFMTACGEPASFLHQSETKSLKSADAVKTEQAKPRIESDNSLSTDTVSDPQAPQPNSDHYHQETEGEKDIDERVVAEVPVIISGSFLACREVLLENNEPALMCTYKAEQKAFVDLTIENQQPVSGDVNQQNTMLSFSDAHWDETSGLGTVLLRKSLPGAGDETKQDKVSDQDADQKDEKDQQGVSNPSTNLEQMVIDPLVDDLIRNGSFENQVVDRPGFINDFYTELDFWSLSNGNAIEVQRNDRFEDGDKQWLELCARSDTGIVQALTLEPGSAYELSFNVSPKGAVVRNHMKVTLGADVTLYNEDIDGTGLTGMNWRTYTKRFVATDAATSIDFRSVECNGSAGNYLDKVSIRKLMVPAN